MDSLKTDSYKGIKYIADMQSTLDNQSNETFKASTDIINGIYEGGFKLWECTKDLIDYLQDDPSMLKDKRVLDMGCGYGLEGIYAMSQSAKMTLFQDFNQEVLTWCTQQNIQMNNVGNACTFISGDWMDMIATHKHKGEENFHIILMSEVIYKYDNYEKVIQVVLNMMNKGGKALLATKMYYFGVGGSLCEFEEYLEENHGDVLEMTSVKQVADKRNNKREVVMIRFKN